MQRQLTINLSDETYRGLMDLVGESEAGEFIESVLRPYLQESGETYEIRLPLNKGKRRIYVRTPRLKNPSDASKLKMIVSD